MASADICALGSPQRAVRTVALQSAQVSALTGHDGRLPYSTARQAYDLSAVT